MDIICFSSIDWDFNWQGHQEVMSRLAAQGHRVLFVENTGVRSPTLKDIGRLSHRVRNWRRGIRGFRQDRPNLFVYSPIVLPFPRSRLARRFNRYLLARALRSWMTAVHFHQPIVWTFLPTALVLDLIEEIDPALVVYYCIADFEQLAQGGARIKESERRLLDRAEVVFVQGPELERKCQPHPNISIFPFGVNLDALRDDVEPASELAHLQRPILGYLGGIHRHVDFLLLEHLARHSSGTLALVGPKQVDTAGTAALEQLPNVAWLGAQPHDRIAQFLKGFDVGLVPYVLSDYTRTVYPTKLNEYLAMGLASVSTDLPEVQRFNERHGGVVAIATGAEAFTEAVRQAVQPAAAPEIERRKAVARLNSWERRVAEMWQIVEAALAAHAAQPDHWQDRLRTLYRSARRRAWPAAAAVALVLLVLFYTPALWVVADPLQESASPRRADAVVVFAGGVGESGRAGGGYQERVKQAVDLYRAGYVSQMVFSSGFASAFREADVMKTLAVSNGVPAEAIVLETQAGNTYENVTRVAEILEPRGWKTVLLVSSRYHMRRALLTWRRNAPDVEVIPVPVSYSEFYDHGRGASVEQVRAIVHEYAAMATYWWKGWI